MFLKHKLTRTHKHTIPHTRTPTRFVSTTSQGREWWWHVKVLDLWAILTRYELCTLVRQICTDIVSLPADVQKTETNRHLKMLQGTHVSTAVVHQQMKVWQTDERTTEALSLCVNLLMACDTKRKVCFVYRQIGFLANQILTVRHLPAQSWLNSVRMRKTRAIFIVLLTLPELGPNVYVIPTLRTADIYYPPEG